MKPTRKIIKVFMVIALLALGSSARSQICGDVDGNGVVDNLDVQQLYDYITGAMTSPPQEFLDAAAVDARTGVDFGDYLHLYRSVYLGAVAPCAGGSYGDTVFHHGVIMLSVSDIMPGFGTKLPINTEITVTVGVWNTNIQRDVFGFFLGLGAISYDGLDVVVSNPVASHEFPGSPFDDACLSVNALTEGNSFGLTGHFTCDADDGIQYDGNYTMGTFTIGPFDSSDVGKTFALEEVDFANGGINAYYSFNDMFVLPYAPIGFGLGHVFTIADPALEPTYICGDLDGSGFPTIHDLTLLTTYIHDPTAVVPQPEAADIDQYAGVDVGDLAYLWDYLYEMGPIPCEGDAPDIIGTGGRLYLDSTHGLLDPNTVAVGEEVTFFIGVNNNTADNIPLLSAGFSVTSPDGAVVPSPVNISVVGDLSDNHNFWPMWYQEQDNPNGFGFFCLTLRPDALEPGYRNGALALTVGPFDAADVGKTIVLDQALFGRGGTTRFMVDGQTPLVPDWSGPYSFTIGERPYLPGDADNSKHVDVGDIVFMVDYMFRNGLEPAYISACDVNGDCMYANIVDLIYLVDHLFNSGDSPEFACSASSSPKIRNSAVGVTSEYDGESTVISLSSDIELLGLQLDLVGGDQASARCLVSEAFDVVGGTGKGLYSLGLLDLEGQAAIEPGTRQILKIPGHCEVVGALACDAQFTAVSVYLAAKSTGVPDGFELRQNYPNPFNPETHISFALPTAGHVKVDIVNILGQTVSTLVNGHLDAGEHAVVFDGKEFASGIYLYRLTTDGFTDTRKMILLK